VIYNVFQKVCVEHVHVYQKATAYLKNHDWYENELEDFN